MGALHRRRIAVTRARDGSEELSAQLVALGADVIDCPTIEITEPLDWTPLDVSLGAMYLVYDWVIFTSRNAVTAVMKRLEHLGLSLDTAFGNAGIAAIGPATRAALSTYGIVTNAMPENALADEIPDALGDVDGLRLLLPRSSIARAELLETLRARGANVDDVIAYRTVDGPGAMLLANHVRDGDLDAITFASASAVRSFVSAMNTTGDLASALAHADRPRIIAIGPVTAATAAELGVPVDAVAAVHDANGLAQAVERCLAAQT
jgi:uroporphyrinogen III methyltransferase/synthase